MKIANISNTYSSSKLNSMKALSNNKSFINYQLNGDSVSFTSVNSNNKGIPTKKSILDLKDKDFRGKTVLVRVDFNVSKNKDGSINDTFRMESAFPTINYLTSKGAKIVLMSHLGDPEKDKNKDNMTTQELKEKYTLKPVAEKLSEMLDRDVKFIPSIVGHTAKDSIEAMENGDIVVLENTRFMKGEKKNDPEFAERLSNLCDIYVNDAFGAAHRGHASTQGVAESCKATGKPALLGLLMKAEVDSLGNALNNPERPFTAIVGGSKVSSKIGVLENLINKVDNIIIGGGMTYTFLKAQGHEVGKSICEDDQIGVAIDIMRKAKEKGVNLVMPKDVLVADKFSENANTFSVKATQIPEDWEGVDAGPSTIADFEDTIKNSKTILWNGPVGVFELEPFTNGTRAVALAVQKATENGATSVLGGGDTVTAVNKYKLNRNSFTHVSTGGGASLEFIEGKILPGVDALENK